jgi:hypothetical protein
MARVFSPQKSFLFINQTVGLIFFFSFSVYRDNYYHLSLYDSMRQDVVSAYWIGIQNVVDFLRVHAVWTAPILFV